MRETKHDPRAAIAVAADARAARATGTGHTAGVGRAACGGRAARCTRRAALGLALASLLGGGARGAWASGAGVHEGSYRVEARLPGGALAFRLDVARSPDGLVADLVNGPDRVRVREVRARGDSLVLHLPAFDSWLHLLARGDSLHGTLTLVKRDGVRQLMPVRAGAMVPTRGAAPSAGVSRAIDSSGRWRVTFVSDDGDTTPAVGEFVQRGDSLYGTFLTPTGDYRFLAGEVEDDSLRLGCFDGAHAFLFTARHVAADTLRGHFWSGTRWHERWTAVRDALAQLPPAEGVTRLRPGARLTWDFPDVDGHRVTRDDPRFRGRVVLVSIAGSWCPNCHDETAFLVELYRRLHARGLEIVSLMFEHYRDFDRAARQVRRFRDKFDIAWPLLVAGYSDKAEATRALPALERLVAYPTLIVIDRRGRVRRIHTGFTGPGTGEHYRRFVSEFTALVEHLLDER